MHLYILPAPAYSLTRTIRLSESEENPGAFSRCSNDLIIAAIERTIKEKYAETTLPEFPEHGCV